MGNGELIAKLTPEIKVGYSRHFKTVSVWKNGEVKRVDEKDEDYTVNEFMNDIENYIIKFNL
jgi:hypothetical protein